MKMSETILDFVKNMGTSPVREGSKKTSPNTSAAEWN